MHFLFKLKGRVAKGRERGKKLGFPTANIIPEYSPENLQNGVYASLIEVDKQVYQSVSHIGPAETFAEHDNKIETFIFNFDNNIYGKRVELKLVKYLRNIKKFDEVSTLVAQIKIDCQQAKDYLNENS